MIVGFSICTSRSPKCRRTYDKNPKEPPSRLTEIVQQSITIQNSWLSDGLVMAYPTGKQQCETTARVVEQEIQFLEGNLSLCLYPFPLRCLVLTSLLSGYLSGQRTHRTQIQNLRNKGNPVFLKYQLVYPNGNHFNCNPTYPTTISRPQNTSITAAFWKAIKESGVRVNPEFIS